MRRGVIKREALMDYKVSDIATKVIATYKDGDVRLVIKATVENGSADSEEEVVIWLQGVDAEGFEVEDAYLIGNITVGGSQTLTRRIFIEGELYKQISRWQVREVIKRMAIVNVGYKVSDIATKVIATGEAGNVQLAIKATVENGSADSEEEVVIWLQGVDAEGFEVEDACLIGNITVGGSQTLTTSKIFIKGELYKQISRWQVQINRSGEEP